MTITDMLFQNWTGLARTAIVGVLAYTALVVLLRVSGKRTLSKMNAFDLVVTVALGSTLATVLLSADVALAAGVTAFVTLIGMQFVIAWLSVRSRTISRLVKAEPRLLVYRGQILAEALHAERVVPAEVQAVLREQGYARLDAVEAVVLETDGSFTVVGSPEHQPATTLANVQGYQGAA